MSRDATVVKRGQGEALSVIGTSVKLLVNGDETGQSWSLMEAEVPRDAGPTPHYHPWDEVFYVLQGQVRVWANGREQVVGVGDLVHIPAGTPHAFRGASEEVARMIGFSAPAHADGFFRDTAREVRDIPKDLPKVPKIARRYGIEFIAP
jgi:quercetin dioxygenase-like cupin family protein